MISKQIVGYIALTLITLSGFFTRTCAVRNQKNVEDPITDQRRINADELITRNVYFEGDKFWSNRVDDIGNCAVLCVRMTKCLSFNFDLGTRNCEMNSDFLTDVENDGEYKPNSVYSSIENWPEEIDRECYHRPCQEDEVCLPTKIAEYMTTSRCLKAWRHAHCEDGWVFHGKYCYYFSTDKLNWSEASDRCKSEGANLVDIEDGYEDRFVRHTLTKRSKDDPNSIYFMYGNDIKEEASWVWGYPEGVEMTYTNWNADSAEPNSNNDPNSDEDCAAFYEQAEYKWVDIACEMNNYYICKKTSV